MENVSHTCLFAQNKVRLKEGDNLNIPRTKLWDDNNWLRYSGTLVIIVCIQNFNSVIRLLREVHIMTHE